MLLLVLLGAGFLIGLVGSIWGLVLAFRTSVWWGLAFIFLPFASLVFMIKYFRESAYPLVLTLLGSGLLVGGTMLGPNAAQAMIAQRIADHGIKQPGLEPPKTDVSSPGVAVDNREAKLKEYQAQADRRCAELTQKRAVTNPNDKAAAAAFNAEVIQYNALLDQIKTMRAELQKP